ncbi:MAG: TonB-dependent receptor [Ignavibacteriales bacterium]|nr:TonB-dependent receptor [Ignavibacteriales bacterium]
MRAHVRRLTTIFLVSLVFQITAVAQEDTAKVYSLSPVIVTATQAFERLSPVTFSNLGRIDLKQRYSVQDVPVLLSELPSITHYSENGNGIGYNYINLRGFDQRRLSVMINGVPQNDPEDHNVYWIDFPDLLASTQGIQVQRGAGSAFYGPPAIGGSVNLTANPFAQEPAITLETMFGFQEYEESQTIPLSTRKFAAAINSGLINERYMLYGRLAKLRTEGYRERGWVDLNSYFLGAVRFDEDATTRVHFFGGPFMDGLIYNGLPKHAISDKELRRQNLTGYSDGNSFVWAGSRRPQEHESFSQPHFELLHEWRLSPSARLNNTLFLVIGQGYFDYDASWADTTTLRIGSDYGFPTNQNPTNAIVRGFVGNRQWGWLPRLNLQHESGELTLGAELRIHRSVHWGKIQFAEGLPVNFDPDYHFYEYNGQKDILSLYGHEVYRIDGSTTLMLDLQLVYNKYGIRNEKYLNYAFNVPYYFWNPRLGVNYNINAEWNAYVSIAHTSREPRLRNLYAAEDSYFGATPQFHADTSGGNIIYDFSRPLARPERLLDVEVGAAFRSSSAEVKVNLFLMDFSDELVKSGQVDVFGQPVTGNAEKTRHAGIEIEVAHKLGRSFMITGNATISQNRFVRHGSYEQATDTAGNSFISTRVLNGNPIAGFPDVMGNLRLTYADETLTASLVGKYVGSFFTDNFRDERNKNDAYTVLNVEVLRQIGILDDVKVTLRAEVRNILDTFYSMSGEGNAFFPAAERNYLVGVLLQL